MKNDIQDKQYIALELTKIAYPPILQTYGTSVQDIYKSYEYFLKQTMEITDEINTVSALKNEIGKLQKENERLKANNRDNFEPLFKDLLKALEDCKGDMEPYVYDTFKSVFMSKIQ